jgi:hypothetical protein
MCEMTNSISSAFQPLMNPQCNHCVERPSPRSQDNFAEQHLFCIVAISGSPAFTSSRSTTCYFCKRANLPCCCCCLSPAPAAAVSVSPAGPRPTAALAAAAVAAKPPDMLSAVSMAIASRRRYAATARHHSSTPQRQGGSTHKQSHSTCKFQRARGMEDANKCMYAAQIQTCQGTWP